MDYINYLIISFKEKASEREGFNVEVSWRIAQQRIVNLLTREENPLSPTEIKEALEFYLDSPKYRDFGPEISVALSSNSLNLWKQKQVNEAWQWNE